MKRYKKFVEEPTMSDKTLLLNVEDLINTAFGTADRSVVNFKMIQAVLHILARQMRLLEQEVEIRVDEFGLEGKPLDSYGSDVGFIDTKKAKRAGRKKMKSGEDEQFDDRDYDRDGERAFDRSEDERGGRGGRRDDDRGGERAGARGRDRDDDRSGERRGSRGRDRDDDLGGERTGSRGRDRDDDQGGERGRSRGKGRDDDRGGERGGSRGRDREDDRGGERRGSRGRARDDDRGGERRDSRSRDRDDDRGGQRGGDRGGARGGDRGTNQGGVTEGGGRGKGGRDREGGGGGGGGGGSAVGGTGVGVVAGGGGGSGGGRSGDRDSARSGGREDDRGSERGGSGRSGDRGGDRGGGYRDGSDREGQARGGAGGGSTAASGGASSADERTTEEERIKRRAEGGRVQSISTERKGHKAGTPVSRRSGASLGRTSGREGSRTSITVTEAARKGQKGGQEKVLVVGKRQSSGGRAPRVGSIDVVTASQFALLEKAVRDLQKIAGPLPTPSLPDNQKLRKDLAQGTASLTDTMQAMQLTARVQAAERGISQMAGLLTQLATTGVLPNEVAGRIGEIQHSTEMAAEQGRPFVGVPGQGPGLPPGQFQDLLPGQIPAQMFGMPLAGNILTGAGVGPAGGGVGFGPYPPDGAAQMFPGGRMESTAAGLPREPGSGAPDSTSTSFRKAVAIDPATGLAMPRTGTSTRGSLAAIRPTEVSATAFKPITHAELENVLLIVKDDLKKAITAMTARATHSADMAASTSKSVAEKMELALRIDKRITKLSSQAADYATQLSGFDSGLTTQMASFQEQMSQMRHELKEGLERLEKVNTNAESAALMDLTERYQGLVLELEHTLHTHQNLTTLQNQLSDELRSLVECVEMLREQKADRDEVFDGLRDKADITRLTGLVHEEDFLHACAEIDKRLMDSYDKFQKQDQVWLAALKDLSAVTERKAEIIQLMALKDSATAELRSIQTKLRQLYIMLGEPKAAVLMRMLAKGAACGACLTPALMEPTDRKYGQPMALPEFRPPPVGQEEPCLTNLQPLVPPDTRSHVCRRWAGGSHTLVSEHVSRERAHTYTLTPHAPPTKRYTGYGTDGRLYMLEEELQPCLECNKLEPGQPVLALAPKPSLAVGAGDLVEGHAMTAQEKDEKEQKEKADGGDN